MDLLNSSWLRSDIFLNRKNVCIVRKLSFVVVSKDEKLTREKRKGCSSVFERQVLECKIRGKSLIFFAKWIAVNDPILSNLSC